ncbi:MAG: hypothetical protein IPI00_06370 [Flavobacteriales bacterium]|nr:hypothetical protein [Flavobacteriales bacterium]
MRYRFLSIVIGMGITNTKDHAFEAEQSINWINEPFAEYPRAEVISFEGVTCIFVKSWCYICYCAAPGIVATMVSSAVSP